MSQNHDHVQLEETPEQNQAGKSAVALGQRIGGRVTNSLRGMRQTTEKAVLRIGNLLQQIVETATQSNGKVLSSIGDALGSELGNNGGGGSAITDVIRQQSHSVAGFVDETKHFFEQQNDFVASASDACEEISSCAESVSKLMGKSHLLALNMQIESVRLGSEGQSFCVIAKEMKNFAAEVRSANENIKLALESLTTVVPQIKQQTAEMSIRVSKFAHGQHSQLQVIEDKTDVLGSSLESTRETAESLNNEILKCSQETLSELQFQDPMAQALQRAEFDISKLEKLISSIHFDDISLAELEPAVGDDGSEMQEPGEVSLF